MKKIKNNIVILLFIVILISSCSINQQFTEEVNIDTLVDENHIIEDNVNVVYNTLDSKNSYDYFYGNFQNMSFVNSHNDIIYYSKKDGIYKLDLDGNSVKIIDAYDPYSINITEEKIYFCSQEITFNEDGHEVYKTILYKANIDGTQIEEVVEGEIIYDVIVHDNKIYFTEDRAVSVMLALQQLYTINTDGSNKELLINDFTEGTYIEKYFIEGNNLFFLRGYFSPSDNRIDPYEYSFLKLNLNNMEVKTIMKDVERKIYFMEKNIYLTDINTGEIVKYNISDDSWGESEIYEELLNFSNANHNSDNIYYVENGIVCVVSKLTNEKSYIESTIANINFILLSEKYIFLYSFDNLEFIKLQ